MSKPDWDRLTEDYRIRERMRRGKHEGRPGLVRQCQDSFLLIKRHFLPHYFGRPPRWRLWLRRFGGPRSLPDFACVGPIKSGTSGLSSYLALHPSILPPLTKEILTTNTLKWLPHYPTIPEKERVRESTGAALCGYFAPWLHNLELMDHYRAVQPGGKIILLLRNPADRAFSHYKWDLFVGGKNQLKEPYYESFSAFVNMALSLFPCIQFPSRCGFPPLESGIYARSVELWIERFGRPNVHVVRAEDFFDDLVATVCGIHTFLGLPPVAPEIREVVNKNPMKLPPPDREAFARLTEFYRPWNDRLYELLGRDMGWDDLARVN